MSSIRVISASAGTGKTYRLTEIVVEALGRVTAPVQPERVIAITYTRKAAGELQSRIRQRLLSSADPQLAGAASRIRDGYLGTIHAVCQRLLWEFALDSGLSPGLELLPESERRLLFRQTLAKLPPEPSLLEAADRMGVRHDDAVIRLVDRARSNRLCGAALTNSAERSLRTLLALLPAVEGDADARDAALLAELERVVPELEARVDKTKASADRAEEAAQLRAAARAVGTPPWAKQVRAAKLLDVAKLASVTGKLVTMLGEHASHPRFRADLQAVAEGSFRLADKAQARFAERKNAARVIDYDDMLALTLPLLEQDVVRAALRERVQLLLVDEFQDTSPIQLAVIQKLAELAQETVWVGDRKQAIFGFQGSDPDLMSAAVDHALAGKAPEIQGESWRSRPPLVDFCSAVFSEALRAHGFPEEQVALKAAREELPELANVPALETWRWGGGKGSKESHAVAQGVATLLAEKPLVREPHSDDGRVRPLERRDVAVICRSNEHCKQVAHALQLRGIPAVVRLEGLSGTIEAQICVAALRLMADPADGVAAATLSWLTGGSRGNPDGWLSAEVETIAAYRKQAETAKAAEAGGAPKGPRPLPFASDAAVEAIRAEHARSRLLSPSEALDVCVVAVDLPRWCMALPGAAQRLANLESLRAAAVAYEDLCRVRRTACTVAGLVAHLGAVEDVRNDDGEKISDAQAVAPAADAVTVVTYHKSKGLEWPVVVLTDLNADLKADVFGMHVQSPEEGFDGAQPLAGRWIRYWPWPYAAQKSGLALADAAAQTEDGSEVHARELRERARLLYVGFTRPRDRLVLVACDHPKNGISTRWLDELADAEGKPVLQLPWHEEGETGIFVRGKKSGFACFAREVDGAPPSSATSVDEAHRWFEPGRRITGRVPEVIRPSEVTLPDGLAGSVIVSPAIHIGARQPVKTTNDAMASVGDAIHRFLAADARGTPQDERLALASRVLDAHGVARAVAPQTLLTVSDALCAQLDRAHPGAKWLHEWPVRWLLSTKEGPRVMVGEVDLVLELEDRLVLVDHKSFPGGPEERDRRAVEHAGQLAAYRAALESAFGKKVSHALIHFALRGELVEVTLPEGAFEAWLETSASVPREEVPQTQTQHA